MTRSTLRTVCAALLLSLLFTSCYGPFRATTRLHAWNGEFDGKWEQEGMFLVLCIVPVYPLAMLGDALLFNSIEFWGGTNPMASSGVAIDLHGDGGPLSATRLADGRVEVRDATGALLDPALVPCR